jgi:hypothetical protein
MERGHLLSTRPTARAAHAAVTAEHEAQVVAAIQWCSAAVERTPTQALATGLFPLIASRDELTRQMSRRMADGSRIMRKENELLTPREYEMLKQRYVAAGFNGNCPAAAKKLIAAGVVDIIKSRGPDGPAITEAEAKKIEPGAAPVSSSWCEKLANIVKREQLAVPPPAAAGAGIDATTSLAGKAR